MINKIIIVSNPDGSCAVVHPSLAMFDPNSRDRKNLEELGIKFNSDQEIIEWIAKKDVPAGLEWRIADSSNLSSNRKLRNAWTDDFDTETIDVNNSEARRIILEELRKKRNVKLKELDDLFARTLEKKYESSRFSLKDVERELDAKLAEISSQKENIRKCTDELKFLDIKELNCPEFLEEIKKLENIALKSLENLTRE